MRLGVDIGGTFTDIVLVNTRAGEMYGTDRIMVNSAGDWGPSNPCAVPDFVMEMRKRGYPESKIRKIVYENPLEFFRQAKNFRFTPPDTLADTELARQA